MKFFPVFLVGTCLLGLFPGSFSQLSDPIAHDSNINIEGNKFLERRASDDSADNDIDDEEPIDWTQGQCPQNFEMRWMKELSSSIYATPLITDLYNDGAKEVVVNSFVHNLEVVEGGSGEAAAGAWPAFHSSSVHASPLLLDIDQDGLQDILVATYAGEVLFFNDAGEQLPQKLVVPRLRVKKNWFVGLDPDWVDHSRPDVSDPYKGELLQEEETLQREQETLQDHKALELELDETENATLTRRLLEEVDLANVDVDHISAELEHADVEVEHTNVEVDPANANVNTHFTEYDTAENEAPLSEEAEEGFDAFADYRSWDEDGGRQGSHEGDDRYTDEGYDGYDNTEFWDNEEWEEENHPHESGFVFIDAHILCTPVVVDLDRDGHMDVVVAVSYFYDREYYDAPQHRHELGEDIDLAKYVAGGIVVFDSQTHQVKWSTHLDLTTDTTQYRAYMYSTPSVADLDGDGLLEVVVGTSVGFIYALNGLDGSNRKGFPIQMGEVQGQVVIADVNDDGFPEVVGCDTRGNVGVFSWRGTELWERHLRSLIAQGPTLGDVNGDGKTEVVVGTTSGYVHVLSGVSGEEVRGRVLGSEGKEELATFPFRTHGRIVSPVLIVRLNDNNPQQHLVVLSFDGYLYAIDGATGCADTYDIGETSYAMVLADDLDGNGRLDLLVSTMNGNLYCYETPARYHPLKSWPQQVQGYNGLVARHKWVGVAATWPSRTLGDIGGETFTVQFEVLDNRPLSAKPLDDAEDDLTTIRSPYEVTITVHTPGHEIQISAEYSTPGTYALTLPVPRQRLRASVSLLMTDSRKMSFVDSFVVSFHMHVHRMLKWILALPFLGMCAVILSMQAGGWQDGTALPTHLA